MISLVNYILGVEHADASRFRLQLPKPTEGIIEYTFHWQKGYTIDYNVVVVDTPGYGKETEALLEAYLLQKPTVHYILYFLKFSPVHPFERDVLNLFAKDISPYLYLSYEHGNSLDTKDALEIPFTDAFLVSNAIFSTYTDASLDLWQSTYKELHRLFRGLKQGGKCDFTTTILLLQQRKRFLDQEKEVENQVFKLLSLLRSDVATKVFLDEKQALCQKIASNTELSTLDPILFVKM